MEQLREHEPQPERRPPAGGLPTEAVADVAAVAGDAAARAAAIPAAAATVTVTVKTTGTTSTRIVATPDTTVGEVMAQACHDLRIRDPQGWALVANGEVTVDGWVLRELVKDGELTMRLVKRPEAGG